MSEAERGAETKLAVDAMADADEAWTKALDDGAHMSGTADELRLTSLLAFGGDHGVTIRWDGTLEPAALPDSERPEGEVTLDGKRYSLVVDWLPAVWDEAIKGYLPRHPIPVRLDIEDQPTEEPKP